MTVWSVRKSLRASIRGRGRSACASEVFMLVFVLLGLLLLCGKGCHDFDFALAFVKHGFIALVPDYRHLLLRRPFKSPLLSRPRSAHSILRAAAVDDDADTGTTSEQDWREFRARLVQQEQAREATSGSDAAGVATTVAEQRLEGWAHETPLIEQGSLLLSAAGDHFAINQQYFHKSVILIIQHDENGDVGLIINRPTAFTTDDLLTKKNPSSPLDGTSLIELGTPWNVVDMGEKWNVWCGGDCQGINEDIRNQMPFCLHTSDALREVSTQIIKGVYLIDLPQARQLVASGSAVRDEFMLLIGYCGWGQGQMQAELDRGDSWTLAAADQKTFLGELREAQVAVRGRLDAALAERKLAESEVPLAASDVGNGVDEWQRLYAALGPKCEQRLTESRSRGDDEHTDEMLNRWIQRCLIPPAMKPFAKTSAAASILQAKGGALGPLEAGTILRASADAWLLGKPAEDADFDIRRFRPAQYLHKGVLLLIQDVQEGKPSAMILLNGPKMRQLSETPSDAVFFGGTQRLGNSGVLEIEGESGMKVEGAVIFPPGLLEKLILLDALQLAEGVEIQEVIDAPRETRWSIAGGKLSTLHESWSAALGDVQRRKWYKRFMGVEMDG